MTKHQLLGSRVLSRPVIITILCIFLFLNFLARFSLFGLVKESRGSGLQRSQRFETGWTLQGRVFRGNVGDETHPLPGVTVSLYGANNPYPAPGQFISRTTTDHKGWYGLTVSERASYEYFQIRVSAPRGYTPVGARSIAGRVRSNNCIEYGYPLGRKNLTGNKFWYRGGKPERPDEPGDKIEKPPQPPGGAKIFEVHPAEVSCGTETILRISGANLSPESRINIPGGINIINTRVVSSRELVIRVLIAPTAHPGPRSIELYGPRGEEIIKEGAFRVTCDRYIPEQPEKPQEEVEGPKIFEVHPAEVSCGSETLLRIHGANLSPESRINIPGGIDIINTRFVSPEELMIRVLIAPAAHPGPRSIELYGERGEETIKEGAFRVTCDRYVPERPEEPREEVEGPKIFEVHPTEVSCGSENILNVFGANLRSGVRIKIPGDVELIGARIVNPEKLVLRVLIPPSASPGPRSIEIYGPEGRIMITGKEEAFVVTCEKAPPERIEEPELPDTLLIGDFVLKVDTYTDRGNWDFAGNRAVGVSGTAWLTFDCGYLQFIPLIPETHIIIDKVFEVVTEETDSANQISIEKARLVKPGIRVGEHLELKLPVEKPDFQHAAMAKRDLIQQLELNKKEKRGDILLGFHNVTIVPVTGQPDVGRIIEGSAVYPTPSPDPEIIRLTIDGFTALIDNLVLTPTKGEANITLQLPESIIDEKTCQPSAIDLGKTEITPKCEFYAIKPNGEFGPFFIGSTGILVSGTGFEVNFSSQKSWRGVRLFSGQTIAPAFTPVISNRGYLKANYSFLDAYITDFGFKGKLQSNTLYTFRPLQPIGYKVAFSGAEIHLEKSELTGGNLNNCVITLPTQAVTDANSHEVSVTASVLTVQPDGDLEGKVVLSDEIYWGELTHSGAAVLAYSAGKAQTGYFYLSAQYKPAYWPTMGAGFQCPDQTQLETQGVQGVTIPRFDLFKVHTPDTPNKKPLVFQDGDLGQSWVNIVSQGVHGWFTVIEYPTRRDIKLGPTHSSYYVGKTPFSTRVSQASKNPPQVEIKFVNSAVYDSQMNGLIRLAKPSNTNLVFKQMQFTSTAHNAGGQVDLTKEATLDYWGLTLVQKANFSSAGLVCVKTGQIILTAAGLKEKRHFDEPFYLTWGELLADGNLGRLFFDYNNAEQKFDGFDFSPSALRLSKYDPGKKGYLQAGGTASFDFFGDNYLNILDYKHTETKDPWNGRLIELGFDTGAGFYPTNTTIARNWCGTFGSTKFKIEYDDNAQDGFTGKGQVGLEFILDGTMNASLVLKSSRICLSVRENKRHDFTVGPVAHFGSMSSIWGCGCIEEGQLKRFMLGAEIEASGNANVMLRSASYGKLEYMTTPSITELTINGNMYLSLLAGADLEVTARARFKVNRALDYVEGDIYGKFDTSSFMDGLSAEGQLNWHLGKLSGNKEGHSYLQGKLSLSVLSIGIQGGFYAGIRAPKEKAWVLGDSKSRFSLNTTVLPNRLTGVYGFGEFRRGFDIFIFSGGIDVYVGLGGFSKISPPALYAVGNLGVDLNGKILGGLVSAGASGNFQVIGAFPSPAFSFQGTVGLKGCVLWVICGSVDVTVGLNTSEGFYIK